MNVLVTGGTGYIGSHTVVELIKKGNNVVIVDDLSNSEITVIDKIKEITGKSVDFYEIDVAEVGAIEKVFIKYKFDAVIHFAGFKAVGESTQKPLMYYENNLLSTINLTKACVKYKVNKIVFSSSATVYGDNPTPYVETMELKKSTSPYGETKAICERILEDSAKAHEDLNVTLLRYFNPIGAHESTLIGEKPNGIPNNLMPYITQTAKGIRKKLFVFGDDYDTVDGTGVRDYIHVVDLARGHVLALDNNVKGTTIYNFGSGKGTSVLEIINTFQKVNDVEVPYEVIDRRPGDLPEVYANADKAREELGFSTQYTVEDMCRDSWNFEKNCN